MCVRLSVGMSACDKPSTSPSDITLTDLNLGKYLEISFTPTCVQIEPNLPKGTHIVQRKPRISVFFSFEEIQVFTHYSCNEQNDKNIYTCMKRDI